MNTYGPAVLRSQHCGPFLKLDQSLNEVKLFVSSVAVKVLSIILGPRDARQIPDTKHCDIASYVNHFSPWLLQQGGKTIVSCYT